MFQITLEVTQVTPQTWLEVGHVKTIKMDEALPIGAEVKQFGYIAKVIDVQVIEEATWTDEQEKALQEHKAEEINKSFDRITHYILTH
tara:strand:+ start:498 stop:761 length:264 start_codon:yes stop_codon:yes gene_type:complete